jgi:hypothetical protein
MKTPHKFEGSCFIQQQYEGKEHDLLEKHHPHPGPSHHFFHKRRVRTLTCLLLGFAILSLHPSVLLGALALSVEWAIFLTFVWRVS